MQDRRHVELIAELVVRRSQPIVLALPRVMTVACFPWFGGRLGAAQSSSPAGGVLRTDKADLPTAIHQPPDANAQMRAHDRRTRRKMLDAVNAARIQQIADETAKLLLLARDLRGQIDLVGAKPLPKLLIREAEVIEKLARDVQARMTLTVGAG
jgi:hypothetical protein